MANTESIPTPALALGLGGLLPFFAGALICVAPESVGSLIPESWLMQRSTQAWGTLALTVYGAVILSFLGGIRWGHLLNDQTSLNRWLPLSLSVVPSLIAWLALLAATSWTLFILIAGFIIQYLQDRHAAKQQTLPAWFGTLRAILTAGAVISLLVGLIFQP